MLDQPLTRPQAVAILVLFVFGSSVVMGVSTAVAQDSWLSLLLAAAYAAPVLWMYARIISLNPREGLFEAAMRRLGGFFGRLFTALMSWFALHLCALVLRNFSEFIQVTVMLDTPQLPILLIMALVVCMLAKSGAKALGKWAVAALPIVLAIVALTVLFSIGIMDFRNFLPVLGHPVGRIVQDAYLIFSFPFAETVLLMGIADFIRPGDGPGKIYLGGLFFSALVLMVIVARNLTVLGPAVVSVQYFPSYAAVRIINLGDFLSRIESSISINFMLAGITKIALCLITASRGVACLFGIRDYRKLVAPMGLLAVALAQTVYQSTMEMFGFVKYYPYYAIPFEIALPLILWVVSEIRARKSANGARGPEAAAGDSGRGGERPL